MFIEMSESGLHFKIQKCIYESIAKMIERHVPNYAQTIKPLIDSLINQHRDHGEVPSGKDIELKNVLFIE